ncbi:UNVERIFIED_ORG: N-methylhydantoinase B [Rhizobium esperanzae]|uniref:hydantoinase B/oxoprolinase family protein n=1 Tax=Rhizobium phaseoli TaxID=396 RepID=UPI000202BC78|nr:hydantoinase B/oxoprolinase family protein [Rhizobium phaseoli]EGE60622.1 hydantoinase B/oxoprolinase [Rhizobium etli CNPAF512]MDK4730468.1 hydantoinase B/oxoprolinase family protein [Rhizobium phaseoli]NKE91914.1 hydantoinase B/oxoprolinase family protein [Rhizobium phaseoli]PDS27706.1 hydantoinase [Rhizobium phaseoli]
MSTVLSPEYDPVLIAILQRQLDHISLQMGTIMTRTARSPIFSQSHDFSCFLSNADGETIAQADGLPIHSGSGGFAVRAVLRDFSGRIEPEDVFILSDPYAAGGNHLPDWTLIRPVFVEGQLVGFCSNRAHQSDIGGGAAGTYNAKATEIFHEGIRLPVLKLIEKGQLRDDLWRMLLLNSRCPDLLEGDLGAMIGSTRIGGQRLADVIAQLGIEKGRAYLDALLDYGERRMRQAISELPNGVWHASDFSDTDCFELVDIETRIKMTIDDDTITFDFTGTSPQIKGFKNSGIANTHSAVYCALSAFLDPAIPHNEGTYRCVKILAPEGSVVNALPPAPMTMNTVFPAIDIMNACWGALAQADPERACAGWGKSVFGISSGTKPDGNVFVLYHWHGSSGGGAVKGRDGFPTSSHQMTLGGMFIPNVETYEQSYPIRVHRYEMRCDTGGAGQYRGGTGVDYVVDVLAGGEHLLRGEGARKKTAAGVNGGHWGEKGSIKAFDLSTGEELYCPPYGVEEVKPLHLVIEATAGGGWGHPHKRDPASVLRDVRDGVVSRQAALDIYGVAISADGKNIQSIDARRKTA